MSLALNSVRLMAVCPLLALSLGVAAQTCIPAINGDTDSHLTDGGKGIVSDSNTGFEWKKCTEGQVFDLTSLLCTGNGTRYTWIESLLQVQTVNTGSAENNLEKTDWRLPTIKELASIVELSCTAPAINTSKFTLPTGSFSSYWSSSQYSISRISVWGINFVTGNDFRFAKAGSNLVRLVRSGR